VPGVVRPHRRRAHLARRERRYWFGAWGRNPENKAVRAAAATANDPGPGNTFLDPPRTYGVTLALSF
jgi:hypothetical protein